MKIVIIGAGSPYSPEIVKELSGRQDKLCVSEIALHDIDAGRLEIIMAFLKRYARSLGMAHVRFCAHTDWNRALSGADFVITQFRVGGTKARVQDERIPMRHGFIGQETTGPGGMMKAFVYHPGGAIARQGNGRTLPARRDDQLHQSVRHGCRGTLKICLHPLRGLVSILF